MDVQVRWKAARRSRAVEEHLRRRLGFGVGRFAGAIAAVRVWLEDVNGPRGGRDKRCAIEVRGARGAQRVERREASFYAAVDRAVHALARSVSRATRPRRGRSARLDDALSVLS